jgi:integrase
MSRTPRVNFYLEKRKDKKTGKVIETNVPVIFSLSYGNRYKSSTGIRIDYHLWDEEKQRVKASHTRAAELNRILSQLRTELETICYDAWKDSIRLSPWYISSKLNKNQRSARGFFDHFDEFIAQGRKKWQNTTVKKFTTMKNHLLAFAEKKKYRVDFDTLDKKFVERLIDYYFEEKKYINSYVRKNVKFIQQYLTWATKEGYNKNMAFKDWEVETGNKKETNADNIIALSPTEFFKIYNFTPTTEPLKRAKDYLTLACFTGLRYSDVANLKKSDINYQTGVISFTTIKTGDRATVPFNDFSREILLKYRKTPNFNKNGIEMAIPVVSGQKLNVTLKNLGKLAGLTEMVSIVKQRRTERIEKTVPKYKLISTHIGRKTFITLSVLLEVQAEVTMGLTTHHSHETMEKYYTVNMEMKRIAMKKFSKANLKKYSKTVIN